ncbi:hypothetical protein BU17DRAFT_68289 [Hysterangium stoloniferum]|nr:hypothetical protein BU17DRAFT_68270 [Hysterangium stoloniferum]KAF8514734.1 hypothetical protein BU17DRAFT_68289 [Hysterangium stoloniferum]
MIDFGFVIGSFVPLVLFWIFGDKHLNAVWRGTLGLGVIPAAAVFIWRFNMRRYWVRLTAICIAWFIYDFITYPFGLFSSTVLNSVEPTGTAFTTILGWNVVINLFYMPGTLVGAFAVDWLTPKYTMIAGFVWLHPKRNVFHFNANFTAGGGGSRNGSIKNEPSNTDDQVHINREWGATAK